MATDLYTVATEGSKAVHGVSDTDQVGELECVSNNEKTIDKTQDAIKDIVPRISEGAQVILTNSPHLTECFVCFTSLRCRKHESIDGNQLGLFKLFVILFPRLVGLRGSNIHRGQVESRYYGLAICA